VPIESTYRLQFHAGFTFRDATAVVPYLARLGITHVYASPYLKARPGSTHGYDVVDHSKLNPELGTQADFDAFLGSLQQHGMSHILDIVPNHVGVATNDNKWWNDVLEHGPSSRFAGYFDITWRGSPRPELHDKGLLAAARRAVRGRAGEGTISFGVRGRYVWRLLLRPRFPISPRTYAKVLLHRVDELQQSLRSETSTCSSTRASPTRAGTYRTAPRATRTT
jgi:(1->4)-alpha-D-glucan 1-alpha-D-glucosylmutase